MERAAYLLEDDVMSVGEIAAAVGYQRASSFTVAFERCVGCSSQHWRKRVLEARAAT